MRKIYTLFILLGLSFSACDSYFDVELHQEIPSESAYNTVTDIKNALNGAYYAFGSYRFHGRNLVALGDLASDNAVASASSGHFVAMSSYTYSETSADLEEIWTYGYQVIDRTTRLINGASNLLETQTLSDADKSDINMCLAQSYALRAYSAFMMVNLWGLPYGTDDAANGGIVIVEDEPILPTQTVSRSSVAETYAWILRDIEKALALPNDIKADVQFYFNTAAIHALSARVNLYMKDFAKAKTQAQAAIDLRASTPVSNIDYLNMWGSIAITPEDIFTVAKTADDNLSANSLNTLYSTYGSAVTADLVSVFSDKDIRRQLIGDTVYHPMKFDGIPNNEATNNVPVFRVSEMKLIIAESNAQLNLIPEAQDALLFTAKRDSAIVTVGDLPSDKTELLDFISLERRRELFTEGHRWFDARRTGILIDVNNGKYKDYDIKRLVYPIPADEINSGGGVQQNTNWADLMPS